MTPNPERAAVLAWLEREIERTADKCIQVGSTLPDRGLWEASLVTIELIRNHIARGEHVTGKDG
jgi:hypothetical protein